LPGACGLLALALWIVGLGPGLGPSSVQAQSASEAKDEPVVQGGAGLTGIGQYLPGRWGDVAATVRNETSESVQVLLGHRFEAMPSVQFMHELWVPAGSSRQAATPVRTPESIDPERRDIPMTTLLLDTSGAIERQLDREPGLLLQGKDPPLAGLLSEGEGRAMLSLVARTMQRATGRRSMSFPRLESLPRSYASWEALNLLVIDRDDLPVDPYQRRAMQRWLLGGGRLWLAAQRLESHVLARLLGDDWTVTPIRKQRLTRLTIEGEGKTLSRAFVEPVNLLKVDPGDFDVRATVNGWPVWLEKTIGDGRVILTTLDARAWFEPDDSRTPEALAAGAGWRLPPVEQPDPPEGKASELIRDLARDAAFGLPPGPVATEAMRQVVADEIGYRTLSRGLMGSVLGLSVLVVLAGGLALYRQGRLEWVGVLGAGAAAVFGLAILLLGAIQGQQVPLTVASGQFVRIAPSQQSAVVEGVMSVYSPRREVGRVRIEQGGVIWWPETAGRGGRTLRTIFSDLERWRWENLTLPPRAVLNADFVNSIALDSPVRATGRLTAQGLSVSLETGPFGEASDPLVVGSAGVLTPRRMRRGGAGLSSAASTPSASSSAQEAGGNPSEPGRAVSASHWVASPEDAVRAGQYVRSMAQTAEQSRRQRVYEQLFASSRPASRSVLFWARPLDIGFDVVEGASRRSWALVQAPLQWSDEASVEAVADEASRSVAGESGPAMVVPSALVPFEVVRGPGGSAPAAIYNKTTGEWVGALTTGYEVWLRFQLPAPARQMRIERLRLRLDIEAPDRTVTIVDPSRGRASPLAEIEGPLTTVRTTIEDVERVQPDAGGGVTLGILVSDPPTRTGMSQWVIEGAGLTIEGQARVGGVSRRLSESRRSKP